MRTQSQADSAVSQAANNFSQEISTSPQVVRASNSSQVNNAGSQPGTQSWADSAVSQAFSPPQMGRASPQPGRNTGNAAAQSAAARASPRHLGLVPQEGAPLGLPGILPPKGRDQTGRPQT